MNKNSSLNGAEKVLMADGGTVHFKELKQLEHFKFQNWVIDELGARATRKKVGNIGLDGYLPNSIWHERIGIKVKQSEKIGRNVIDNFETALKRAKYKKGLIVAFSFTKGAKKVARAKNKGEIDITLITIEDLLRKKKIKRSIAGELSR